MRSLPLTPALSPEAGEREIIDIPSRLEAEERKIRVLWQL
jgi:hypothetical protein